MSSDLTDQAAVVTGAASGNGRAIALAMADAGADVVVADVREEPRAGGTPTHERIEDETDREARFVDCDVTERGDLVGAVDAAEAFGGLDVMVNNAGIIRTGPIGDLTEADFEAVMDVNVMGVFLGSQVAAERLRGRGGAIVNLSSMVGIVGAAKNSLYCASKGAVRLFTYALAAELGPDGVRVNAVHPGPVDTAMIREDAPIVGTERGDVYEETIPLGRFGRPEDVAEAVVYLASDRAGYVTGSSLVVDGGLANTGGVSRIDPEG